MLQPRRTPRMGAKQFLVYTTLLVTALWPNLIGHFLGALCDPLPLTSSSSSSQVTINFRCPEQFGYYADEYNCSKYFVCVFGEALHESCTGGLRFSSELQTCDWPRNVVCPSEDSEYDEGENDSNHQSQGGHSKQQASGVVAERPGTTPGTPLGGYVMSGKAAHPEPARPQHYATTTPTPTSFTTEFNEESIQESYDKLIKKSQRNHKHLSDSNLFSAARPVDSIDYLDLNSNKLDSNSTHDGDLTGDELDENFTLVDLQRSGMSLGGGKLGRTPEIIPATLNDNVLGTVGRSVGGENRAQSVSVVASTSSEAVIPELDFVFKKQHEKVTEKQPKSHGTSANNRILLDELLHVSNYRSGERNSQTAKFEEAITAIVGENGAIQLEGEDGPALYRIIAPLNKKPFEANSLPGTAASNRNTASQQVALPKNYHELSGSDEQDKFMYQQTSQPKRSKVESELDSATMKAAKSASQGNTILVFNRTQLVDITSNSAPDSKMNNSSATLILIDHQQPTATVLDGRESLLSGFSADRVEEQSTHRMSDKKRQPIVIRTDKDSIDAQDSYGSLRGYNMASMTAQAKNKSALYVGFKDRHKPSGKQHTSAYSTTPPLMDNEEDIEILVNIPSSPSQETINDFQRIHSGRNSSLEKKHINNNNKNGGWRPVPNYKHSNSSNQGSSHRVPSGHHIGTHQRGNAKSTHHNSTSTRFSKNLSLQIPSRPTPLYPTPEAYSPSTKCNEQHCRLPDCFCGGTDIPGGLAVSDVPQLVLISFDDAVNDVNWHIYEELLNSGRSNPNGCPIKATFYVSHEWTDYSQIQTLYSRGHEISSHSITHTFGERFTKQKWHKEIAGQREILHLYGGVNRADIRGMRAPFLQAGGNKQFEMLHEDNFTYDSSMPVFENSPPFWPYTLDYSINHECMIAPCPTKSFPGLWEIGLVMWQDLRGGRCSMGDACSNPTDENGVYDMIMKNFKRHYESNRAPFGLYYHSAWFNSDHHRRGFLRVIDDLLTVKDVYFVTKWELIQWIRNPTPLKELYRVNLFGCARDPHRPPPCLHPNICNVGFHSGSRFLKTCQPCPKRYPWLEDTGQ